MISVTWGMIKIKVFDNQTGRVCGRIEQTNLGFKAKTDTVTTYWQTIGQAIGFLTKKTR